MTERRILFGAVEDTTSNCDGCGKHIGQGQGKWINRYVGLQTKRYYVHKGTECEVFLDIALRQYR